MFFLDLAEERLRIGLCEVSDDVCLCCLCVWPRPKFEKFGDAHCYVDEVSRLDHLPVCLVSEA